MVVGGTLIDGTAGEPLADAAIFVRDGKFVAVTTAAKAAALLPHAQRLDARGKWLIPGLVDAHVHYYEWMDEALLSHGVTTVRDVGANADRILDLRRRSRAPDAKGPRLFACGPLIDGAAPRHGLAISVSVTTEAEAAREARRLSALGVDCLKVYEQLALPLVRAVVEEARRAGIPVTAHLRDTSAADALRAGVSGLEHGSGFDACDEDASARVARLVVERQAYVVPTLVVRERFVPDTLPCVKRFAARLAQQGGRVVAGSDSAMSRPQAGAMLHRELWLLVEAGLSPREALRAATALAADALGAGSALGTVEPGKTADLVVLGGDPLASISAVGQVDLVLRDGRVVWTR